MATTCARVLYATPLADGKREDAAPPVCNASEALASKGDPSLADFDPTAARVKPTRGIPCQHPNHDGVESTLHQCPDRLVEQLPPNPTTLLGGRQVELEDLSPERKVVSRLLANPRVACKLARRLSDFRDQERLATAGALEGGSEASTTAAGVHLRQGLWLDDVVIGVAPGLDPQTSQLGEIGYASRAEPERRIIAGRRQLEHTFYSSSIAATDPRLSWAPRSSIYDACAKDGAPRCIATLKF